MFRIGLHAGPAFLVARDLITGRPNAYGWDESRAARIEPIVQPGQAWASRSFTLLAHAMGKTGLAFESLGDRELSKGAGVTSLYRIRQNEERKLSPGPDRGRTCLDGSE
jgi:class 3 adenylate cyclase